MSTEMLNKKITVVRDIYYEYDDARIITLPHQAAGEKTVNMMRTVYRKIKFFFFSLGILFGMLFFVKSSKYEILQNLHYGDLIDAMKKD